MGFATPSKAGKTAPLQSQRLGRRLQRCPPLCSTGSPMATCRTMRCATGAKCRGLLPGCPAKSGPCGSVR
eukprot:15452885-Alexandrium_andersonii.AAC.1